MQSNKNLLFFTWFGWSLMAILAMVYAEERVLNIDGAFVITKLFNNPENLHLSIMRPVLMLILAVPNVLAVCGIKGKFLIYLISFFQMSISGFCILYINHIIKKPQYAVGLLLTMILFSNYSFYWSIAELVYGLCFFWVWLAMIEDKEDFRMQEIPWIFFWATCHPTVVFVMFFYFGYRLLFMGEKGKNFGLRLLTVFLSILCVKLIIFQPYEKGKMGLIYNVIRIFPQYFNQPVYKSFISKGLLINLPSFLLFFYGLIFLWKVDYRKSIYSLVCFFGLFFIINACYYFEIYDFYLEANYVSLSFIIAFTIIQGKGINEIFIKSVSLIKIAIILWCSQYWTYQLETYKSIQEKLRKEKFSKLILLEDYFPKEKFYLTHVSGYVSMGLQFIEPEKKWVHFVIVKSAEKIDLEDTSNLITEWERYKIKDVYNPTKQELNGKYEVKKEKYYGN